MYLFVDETECPEYFIVTGLLVNSKEDIELAYKAFQKECQNNAHSSRTQVEIIH